MNWYYAAGVALICLTIAIPIWAASRVEEDLETAPAILPTLEQLDD
jgi:hypothetical protein